MRKSLLVVVMVLVLAVGLSVQTLNAARSTARATVPTAGTPSSTGMWTITDSGPGLVVGLGDSLTFRPASWFRQACAAGVAGTCRNAGVVGNTTEQMYRRLTSQVLDLHPDAMVLMGGANDLRHHATTAQIVGRLAEIVSASQAAGVPVVLCTVPPQDRHGDRVPELNRAIRGYATAAGLPLLDMYATVGTAGGHYRAGLSTDGLHPDRAGFTRMARVAEAELPGLLASAAHPTADLATT